MQQLFYHSFKELLKYFQLSLNFNKTVINSVPVFITICLFKFQIMRGCLFFCRVSANSDIDCLQTLSLLFKFVTSETKVSFVTRSNALLVGTSLGDVSVKYTASFSLTWSAVMQISWKKRVEYPQDLF